MWKTLVVLGLLALAGIPVSQSSGGVTLGEDTLAMIHGGELKFCVNRTTNPAPHNCDECITESAPVSWPLNWQFSSHKCILTTPGTGDDMYLGYVSGQSPAQMWEESTNLCLGVKKVYVTSDCTGGNNGNVPLMPCSNYHKTNYAVYPGPTGVNCP